MYVDGLLEIGNLSEEDRAGIDSRCGGAGRSVEAMLSDASGALAGLSHYAGLVLAPKTEHPFKQVEFIPLSPGRALVVVVSSNGMVENRVIEVPVGIGASTLLEAGNYLTARLDRSIAGRGARDHRARDRRAPQRARRSDQQGGRRPGSRPGSGERSADEGVLIVRGQAKLLDDVTNLADLERIRALFELLETKRNLIRLIELVQKRARRADLHRLGERAVRDDRLLGGGRRPTRSAGRTPGRGQDRRRDRRDRSDPDELCADHPDGGLHRAGGLAPPGQPRPRVEAMNQTKTIRGLRDAPEASEPAEQASADRRRGATRPAPRSRPRPSRRPREVLGREAELEAELAATKERLLRALAETENLRRRAAREVEEAHKYAITGFARELLEVADNLSRALTSIPPRAREEIEFVRSLADGVALTEKTLLASFERHQIAKVVPELGSRFDHNRHQAMLEIETSEHPPGTVAQVMQPGYVIADRLLRPALVGRRQGAAPGPGDGDGQPIPIRAGQRLDTTA